MYSAVLFDLDNTLIDRDGAFRALLAQRFVDARSRTELMRLDARGHGDRAALFAAWARLGGGPMDQDMLAEGLAEHIRPDETLLEALGALETGRLGVITNGGSRSQRLKFEAAGLGRVIERLWISREVGLEKPDPRIFTHACSEFGVPPSTCLYVGDHPHYDGRGATAAGLQVWLVDRVLCADRLRERLR